MCAEVGGLDELGLVSSKPTTPPGRRRRRGRCQLPRRTDVRSARRRLRGPRPTGGRSDDLLLDDVIDRGPWRGLGVGSPTTCSLTIAASSHPASASSPPRTVPLRGRRREARARRFRASTLRRPSGRPAPRPWCRKGHRALVTDGDAFDRARTVGRTSPDRPASSGSAAVRPARARAGTRTRDHVLGSPERTATCSSCGRPARRRESARPSRRPGWGRRTCRGPRRARRRRACRPPLDLHELLLLVALDLIDLRHEAVGQLLELLLRAFRSSSEMPPSRSSFSSSSLACRRTFRTATRPSSARWWTVSPGPCVVPR